MITFPHGISDEAIETLAEQTQEEVATATHNLAVKRKIMSDKVNINESLGGQRYSNMTTFGKTVSSSSKSPFATTSLSQNLHGGRISYDMSFSYLFSTDLMPDEYGSIQTSDDSIIGDIWNKTNGNHLPFIFSVDNASVGDNAESEHIFARFAQNELEMNQVAPDIYNVKMKIEEEF